MEERSEKLAAEVGQLKGMLVTFGTGGEGDDAAYRRLRSVVIESPALAPLAPAFLRRCRSLAEFWDHIKRGRPTYADRRTYLRDAFEPLLDQLERGLESLVSAVELKLRRLESDHVADVWHKALARCTHDQDGAVTAARNLIESVCKHILDDLGVTYGTHDDLPKLYTMTAQRLNIAPSQHTEALFRQILGGCQAVVEGLGALRNRLSDAHGVGKAAVRPAQRHAELAVNLAGSMAMFLVATWEARKGEPAQADAPVVAS